ncbi:MAG: tRNA preQ1(34) S-adenosylmethionine ribosyltransferase-isomerase QueA [Candidatus Dormibacteria bacterium]
MSAVPARALPLSAFDYDLPAARIAQDPVEPRDASRLLHAGPDGRLGDHAFTDLPSLLRPGDLLVVNDTRVRAARLRGLREDGGPAEVLLLERQNPDTFAALVRPGRQLRTGAAVRVGETLTVRVLGPAPGHPGARRVELNAAGGDVEAAIAAAGEVPLPPYITRPLADSSRYQTVYARGAPVSAAAPTAGLHVTDRVRAALRDGGVAWTAVQLDVGLGTFAPITAASIDAHRMHAERCSVGESTAALVARTRAAGGRVIAVGTTVVRTLESHTGQDGTLHAGTHVTDLYITPGRRVRSVDGLLTNFHQPRSSLLVLLAAFMGPPGWRATYAHALREGYRFLSFGDCMLCWNGSART